jgi:hypothetical protein
VGGQCHSSPRLQSHRFWGNAAEVIDLFSQRTDNVSPDMTWPTSLHKSS